MILTAPRAEGSPIGPRNPSLTLAMHPPLFQAHPLCQPQVESFTRCHVDHPVAKFFNACGDLELEMNACFKEEKNMRRQLNTQRGTVALFKMTVHKQPATEAAPAETGGK